MTEVDEAWDDAVIAFRSRGASIGRVAAQFGVTREEVLAAQERVNWLRKGIAEEAARAARAARIEAARIAKEAAEAARAEAPRHRDPKPSRPALVRLDPSDFMNLQQLAARWEVSMAEAKRHAEREGIEAVKLLADAEAWYRVVDVLEWERDASRTYPEIVGREPFRPRPTGGSSDRAR